MGTARAWRERGVSALPDALDSGFHGVRTPLNRGFMAFRLVRRIRTVMLMVPRPRVVRRRPRVRR